MTAEERQPHPPEDGRPPLEPQAPSGTGVPDADTKVAEKSLVDVATDLRSQLRRD